MNKEKKSTRLTAYIPIIMPRSWEDVPESLVRDSLKELQSSSEDLEFSPHIHQDIKPTFEVLDASDVDQTYLDQEMKFSNASSLLKVSATVPVSSEKISLVSASGETRYVEGEQAADMNKVHLGGVFEKGLYDLAVVTNIARPGSLEFGRGVLTQDHAYQSTTDEMGKVYLLREAVQLANSKKWPEVQTLDLAQVWHWSNKQEGFLEGFGGGTTGRALNAFANLFQSNVYDEVSNLVWALLGIEALYTEGQIALQKQVKEKSQSFLGKQTVHKRTIGQMYNFRSRFLHGDLDFPGKYPLHDASYELARYDRELFESIQLAEAILLATLQKLIELDWNGLTFSYQVDDTRIVDYHQSE